MTTICLCCPGNSSDLNPIQNAWNYMKDKVQEVYSSSDEAVGTDGYRTFPEVSRIYVK